MAASKLDKTKESTNYVHQNCILAETVSKENRHQKIFTNYGINPFRKIHVLAGKPNSSHDSADGDEDTNFLRIIKRANLEPEKKYAFPQTESQEYGWINQPLIEHDLTDRRLNFNHQHTSITKYMDVALRMKEPKEKPTK